MMAHTPCPCSEDAGATRAGPHLPDPKAPWATPALSPSVLSAAVGWLRGQKKPLGYAPKLGLRARSRRGLEQPRGRGARCAAPAPQALAPVPLSPCSLQPLARCRRGRAGASPAPPPRCLPPPAGSGAPAAPRHCPLALRAPAFPQPQGSTPGCPLPAGPAAPFVPSAQICLKCGILFPRTCGCRCVSLSSSLRRRLQSWVCRVGSAAAWRCPCAAVKCRAASRHPQAWLSHVPHRPPARCRGRSPEHPSALAALCCADMPPCSFYQAACWSARCLYQVNSLSRRGTQ